MDEITQQRSATFRALPCYQNEEMKVLSLIPPDKKRTHNCGFHSRTINHLDSNGEDNNMVYNNKPNYLKNV